MNVYARPIWARGGAGGCPMTKTTFSLKGRNAVVTGAGTGIGRAIALVFADASAQVACIDLNEKAAEETSGLVRERGQSGIAVGDFGGGRRRGGSRHDGVAASRRSTCWSTGGARTRSERHGAGTLANQAGCGPRGGWGSMSAARPGEPRLSARDDRRRWRQHSGYRPWPLGSVAGARASGIRRQGRTDPARQGDGDGPCGAECSCQHALAGRGRDRAAGAPLRRHGNRAAPPGPNLLGRLGQPDEIAAAAVFWRATHSAS